MLSLNIVLVPPKSVVWKYFVKKNSEGKCKLCQREVKGSGNTTNLQFYLDRSYPKLEMTACVTENSSAPSLKRKQLVMNSSFCFGISIRIYYHVSIILNSDNSFHSKMKRI